MIFKCGPKAVIYSCSIILVALVCMKMEGRIHSIQIISNDFNGFNNLCLRKLFNFLSFSDSVVRYYGFYCFHNESLVNLLRIISLKTTDF